MSDSPAAVLVDPTTGDTLAVVADGLVKKLDITTKVRDSGGDVVNPATEDGNLATLAEVDFATQTTLAAIKDTDGIKKITDPLPAGENTIGSIDVQGAAQSGSYPNPRSIDLGETAPFNIDGYGNLQGRSTVLTDEESFRDDFSGDSIFTDLTGTVSFTASSTEITGVGTAFTTELMANSYIRLGSHTDDKLAQVDWVEDDTILHLIDPYTGASGSGAAVSSNWKVTNSSSSSVAVSSSVLTLTNATGNNEHAEIQRAADYLPFVMTATLSLSQRIANQETFLGFRDDFTAPEKEAAILFTGTDSSVVTCRSSFASDSIQTSTVRLPGTAVTTYSLVYQIELTPNAVSFLVDGVTVAKHMTHMPGPYDTLSLGARITNTSAVGSQTVLSIDSLFFQNNDQVQSGNAYHGEPQSIQGVANGVPVTVQFGNPGGLTAVPYMLNMSYNKNDGGIISAVFKRVVTYLSPLGYNGYLIKFTSFQGEAAASRFVAEKQLATFNDSTQVFVSTGFYTAPQWVSITQAEVTTQFASGSGNVVLTVTYTNESGVGSRTGTITIPKGSVVGARFDLVLQTGDLGLRSIQNVTGTPTQVGVAKILGLLQLSVHQDQSTSSQTETLFAPGAITFPPGTILGIEYAGGTVSKQRTFDALIQLIPA